MHLAKRCCVVLLTCAGACATARREPHAAAPESFAPATPAAPDPWFPAELAYLAYPAGPEGQAGLAGQTTPPSEPAPAPPPAQAKAPRRPRLFADMGFGGGVYSHDTRADSSVNSGHADAGMFRMRGEYVFDQGIGGGMAIEGIGSDDDLFGDNGGLDVQGHTGDFFLYFVADASVEGSQDSAFRIPLRVGPYYHATTLDDDLTSLKTTWNGFGLRLEIEPELWLLQRRSFALGVYGIASGGLHASVVTLKGGGGKTHFDGEGATLGAEGGVQCLFARHVTTRLGYVYRAGREDESDTNNFLRVSGATTSFSGVLLSVGVRF